MLHNDTPRPGRGRPSQAARRTQRVRGEVVPRRRTPAGEPRPRPTASLRAVARGTVGGRKASGGKDNPSGKSGVCGSSLDEDVGVTRIQVAGLGLRSEARGESCACVSAASEPDVDAQPIPARSAPPPAQRRAVGLHLRGPPGAKSFRCGGHRGGVIPRCRRAGQPRAHRRRPGSLPATCGRGPFGS